MTGLRILLAICANADANGAHFGNPQERLNIQRAAARGYVTIVRKGLSDTGNREIYACLTPLGRAKLRDLHGEAYTAHLEAEQAAKRGAS